MSKNRSKRPSARATSVQAAIRVVPMCWSSVGFRCVSHDHNVYIYYNDLTSYPLFWVVRLNPLNAPYHNYWLVASTTRMQQAIHNQRGCQTPRFVAACHACHACHPRTSCQLGSHMTYVHEQNNSEPTNDSCKLVLQPQLNLICGVGPTQIGSTEPLKITQSSYDLSQSHKPL